MNDYEKMIKLYKELGVSFDVETVDKDHEWMYKKGVQLVIHTFENHHQFIKAGEYIGYSGNEAEFMPRQKDNK